jgi:hypothetical protein
VDLLSILVRALSNPSKSVGFLLQLRGNSKRESGHKLVKTETAYAGCYYIDSKGYL